MSANRLATEATIILGKLEDDTREQLKRAQEVLSAAVEQLMKSDCALQARAAEALCKAGDHITQIQSSLNLAGLEIAGAALCLRALNGTTPPTIGIGTEPDSADDWKA